MYQQLWSCQLGGSPDKYVGVSEAGLVPVEVIWQWVSITKNAGHYYTDLALMCTQS